MLKNKYSRGIFNKIAPTKNYSLERIEHRDKNQKVFSICFVLAVYFYDESISTTKLENNIPFREKDFFKDLPR